MSKIPLKCTPRSTSPKNQKTTVSNTKTAPLTSKPTPLPLKHFCQVLKKYEEDALQGESDAVRFNLQMNEVFMRRLREIECAAGGNMELKIITYQEWVDALLHVNETLLSNMVDLESEVATRVALAQQQADVECRQNKMQQLLQEQNNPLRQELTKAKNDIGRLLTVIKCGYNLNQWDLDTLCFETIDRNEILQKTEMSAQNCVPKQPDHATKTQQQDQGMRLNMKALALEVAEKHDEVRDLKKQIVSLEEEIHNAQKKIQLKDNVIKELRTDLKNSNMKHTENLPKLPDGLALFPNENYNWSGIRTDIAESIKCMENELHKLFSTTKQQNFEEHRKRLTELLQKSELEKMAAYSKLDYLCQQLVDIERFASCTDLHKVEEDIAEHANQEKELRIVESLRRRIQTLNEQNFKLMQNLQTLQIKNSVNHKLLTEKGFNNRNGEILGQIADLLTKITGTEFSVEDIYNPQSDKNPFCEVLESFNEDFKSREKQLQVNLDDLREKTTDLEKFLEKTVKNKCPPLLNETNVTSRPARDLTPPQQLLNTTLIDNVQREQANELDN